MPNRYTGTENDPFQEAQHIYTGPAWAKFFASLGGSKVRMSAPGGQIGASPSLGAMGTIDRIGDDDVQRSLAINGYLGDLQDDRRFKEQSLRAMTASNDAADAQARDRQSVERAVAIANSPNVSAQGRAIIGDHGDYRTAPPEGGPVDRQQLAAQMAPGLIPPPAPPKPVTFDDPKPLIVGGKRVMTRAGSDGLTYTMDRKPIPGGSIQPDQKPGEAGFVPPTDAQGAPLMGDALLQTLPAAKQKLLTSVLEGRQSIPTGAALKDPYWKDVIETANLVDPNFDTVNYNARANARKDFTSGKAAGQINAINTVIGHLHDLADVGSKLDNTGYDFVNAIRNKLTSGGSPRGVAINNFETLKEGVATELMRTWRQVGAGSEKEIEDWKAQISSAKSPQELQGAFKTIGGMLESKLGALDSQYKQGMGTDKVTAITPESRQRLDALQGLAAAPPAGLPPLGAGEVYATDPQGNIHKGKAGTALPPGWKLQGGG